MINKFEQEISIISFEKILQKHNNKIINKKLEL